MGYVEGIEIDEMGLDGLEISFRVFSWTRNSYNFCLIVLILKYITTILTYKVRDITLQMASCYIASTVNVHFSTSLFFTGGRKRKTFIL